jgi:hypothetical protein
MDPVLLRLLEAPGNADTLVSAIFRLRPAEASQPALPPRETERQASLLVDRVSREVGEPAERVNVFKSLGSFVVRARPVFLRELLRQPEIEAALANRVDEELMVKPAHTRALAPQRSRRRRR